MAVAMKALKKAEVPLAGDLVFSGVVGEEGDCSIGAEDIARNGPRTDYAIVGEPTDLDVCVAHKGLYNFKVEIVGKTAHSATPQLGVNAIQKCSLLLRELARIEEIGPRHMLLDRTTVVPTTIRGGYRGDVIPDSCTLNITCRNVPAYPVAKLKERLQRLIDTLERRDPTFKAKLSLPIRTVKSNFGPLTFDPRPVETPKSSLIVRSLIRSTRLFGGKSPTVKGARLFADASILQNHGGIETCLFGPSGPRCGAHSAVEYIEVEDLVKAARIYTATAVDICEVQT
jgi:acetylornithine deacetylase/succinyl-diaminopimelate desuccinylase-like protein